MASLLLAWLSEHGPQFAWTTAAFVAGGLVTALMTYFTQRATVNYERNRDDIAQAWDDLLKPLYDTVSAARWRAALPRFDKAHEYSGRWSDVLPANQMLHDKSNHRLSRLIDPELAVVKQWVADEAELAAHWNQAMSQHGNEARAIFAYLVTDTSLTNEAFDSRVATVMLAVTGLPAAAEWVVTRTVEMAQDNAIWEEARTAAERHRQMAFKVEQRHSATVDALALGLARGRP